MNQPFAEGGWSGRSSHRPLFRCPPAPVAIGPSWVLVRAPARAVPATHHLAGTSMAAAAAAGPSPRRAVLRGVRRAEPSREDRRSWRGPGDSGEGRFGWSGPDTQGGSFRGLREGMALPSPPSAASTSRSKPASSFPVLQKGSLVDSVRLPCPPSPARVLLRVVDLTSASPASLTHLTPRLARSLSGSCAAVALGLFISFCISLSPSLLPSPPYSVSFPLVL